MRLVQLVGAERPEFPGLVGLYRGAGVPARNRRLVSQGCVRGGADRWTRDCAHETICNAQKLMKLLKNHGIE